MARHPAPQASFAGVRYLATSGGLIALDEGGNVKRRFTTLDGLPENDLTALAVFRERLFAGTASAGLVAFDGHSFSGYRLAKPKAAHVSVLVSTESELLIGRTGLIWVCVFKLFVNLLSRFALECLLKYYHIIIAVS